MNKRTIVGGPGKDGLANALIGKSNHAEFSVKIGERSFMSLTEKMYIKITGMTQEGESGERWKINGYEIRTKKLVSMYYNTERRSGMITINNPEVEKIVEKFTH